MRAIFFSSFLSLSLFLVTSCSLIAEPVLPTDTPRALIRVVTWTPPAATPTDTPTSVALPTVTRFSAVISPPAPVPSLVLVKITPTPQSSAIIDFTPTDLSARKLGLTVGYRYDGEWGRDQIFITAFANAEGNERISEIASDTSLVNVGTGRADIHMILSAAGNFRSTELTICLYAAESATPQFLCRNFPYAKSWNIFVPGPSTGPVPPLIMPTIVLPPPPQPTPKH